MSRYFRLMALAATEILFSLPFSLYILVSNMNMGVFPWISWEDTHQNFGNINFVPHAFLAANPHQKLLLDINRWITPAGGFLFFAYFGLAGEASSEYRQALWKLVAPLGIKPPAAKPQSSAWYVFLHSRTRFSFLIRVLSCRSNRLASGQSSTGRDIVTFPGPRRTSDATRSAGTTTVDDKSGGLEIEIKHDTESKHDLESQVSR